MQKSRGLFDEGKNCMRVGKNDDAKVNVIEKTVWILSRFFAGSLSLASRV